MNVLLVNESAKCCIFELFTCLRSCTFIYKKKIISELNTSKFHTFLFNNMLQRIHFMLVLMDSKQFFIFEKKKIIRCLLQLLYQ